MAHIKRVKNRHINTIDSAYLFWNKFSLGDTRMGVALYSSTFISLQEYSCVGLVVFNELSVKHCCMFLLCEALQSSAYIPNNPSTVAKHALMPMFYTYNLYSSEFCMRLSFLFEGNGCTCQTDCKNRVDWSHRSVAVPWWLIVSYVWQSSMAWNMLHGPRTKVQGSGI